MSRATTMGGSAVSSMWRPRSVVTLVASITVQLTRSSVSIRAAAGPLATLQGRTDSVTRVLAKSTLFCNDSIGSHRFHTA